MTVQKITEYCLSKPYAVLEYPHGLEPAVFKVVGKSFATIYQKNGTTRIGLKCEPMLADILCQQYPAITPMYRSPHWIYILNDGSVPDDEVRRQIDHSHELIMKSLTKKTRERIKRERHPLYLFPDSSYKPFDILEGEEYFSNGIFVFNITRMLEHIAAHRGEYALGEIKVADYMTSFNQITPEKCAGADIRNPLILAEISPRRYNVIDGNHRLARAHYNGVDSLHVYMLSPKQHSLFITERKAYDTYIEYWNGKLQYDSEA